MGPVHPGSPPAVIFRGSTRSPAGVLIQNAMRRPLLAGISCLAALLTATTTKAQEAEGAPLLRPTFSVGAGMFGFYGDIGARHSGYSPLVTRFAYEFRAGTPITDWLEVGLFAQHGQLGVNERGLGRNLNFKSRITTGGLQFTYNFQHFLRPDHVVEPLLGIGFESVEFLSKTDLFDAQGRAYNYWSDGTIRDVAENAPNAADAVLLQRDHAYESDIRELDLDGFGKYTERSWAVPLTIGAKMKLGGGFDLRVQGTMHFTFTDLIDGVTDQSRADRAGDARNDRFLWAGATIGYGLDLQRKERINKGEPGLTPEQMDALVLNADEDGDGVTDFKDKCPQTPTGWKVNMDGCPLDGDEDGVADGEDDEPATLKGAPVNARGVTITDDEFLRSWLAYADSGNVTVIASRAESVGGRKPNTMAPPKRIYTIRVGSEVTGISEQEMQMLLSIPDIRTVQNGDTMSFVVGGYEMLPDALRRFLELKKEGVNGEVVAQIGNVLTEIPSEVNETLQEMRTEDVALSPGSNKVIVRVQLGAFRKKLSRDIFSGMSDLMTFKGDDGLMRYYTGVFTDVNAAARHKVEMIGRGFGGAFLVAFKNGKRVSLKEAGARLTRPESLKDAPVNGVRKEDVRYRIQLGTFAGNVPTEVMGTYVELGGVSTITGSEDTRYYHGEFRSRAEADEALIRVKEKGIQDAFVVGDLKGRIILAEDADNLLAQP